MKTGLFITLGAVIAAETAAIMYLLNQNSKYKTVIDILEMMDDDESNNEYMESDDIADEESISEEYDTETENDFEDEMEESSIDEEFPTESNDDIFDELEEKGIEEKFETEEQSEYTEAAEEEIPNGVDDPDEIDFDSLDDDEDDIK